MKEVAPASYRIPDFDSHNQALTCFLNQLTILNSVEDRIDSLLFNIEGELYAELQAQRVICSPAASKGQASLRAAGSLVGVVIEGQSTESRHDMAQDFVFGRCQKSLLTQEGCRP